ncbi:MAG: rRNA (cytidine1402-2-O)-methyltransferase [Blastocatellia bacterium]|nr:rRNA (cytidine1402-2-O)-methyltransferase [Blastocatellia bacterium]
MSDKLQFVDLFENRQRHRQTEVCRTAAANARIGGMPGTLYLVPTPIGNLEDITQRALRILGEVDLIACEDTRHTRKLLNHYAIKTKTISYHEHNERERAIELCAMLSAGKNLALVSDAGTPLVNDPGFRLVQQAIAGEIPVVPLPGPSALVTALIGSGLATDEFFFGGFLPARSGARRLRLGEARTIAATLIFYEAPHRIAATLRDAREVLGERKAVVARELTKLHEEIARGSLSVLEERFSSSQTARGEMVLMIDRTEVAGKSGENSATEDISTLVARLESEGLDHRAALKKAARELGVPRAEAYRRLVAGQNRLR